MFEGRTVTYGPPLFHFTLWIEVEKQVVSPTSEFANVEVDSPMNVEQIRLHTRCYVFQGGASIASCIFLEKHISS